MAFGAKETSSPSPLEVPQLIPSMADHTNSLPCLSHRSYRIGGITVNFPYKAYASQLAFMGKVIATLERAHRDRRADFHRDSSRCHALLESPTGTGKSLSLLCSSLAWLEHFNASTEKQGAANTSVNDSEAFVNGGGFILDSSADGERHSSKKAKTPRIFYATRTHSQITQVVNEYRKTSYRTPMAVLAARKHYCTNKHVCKKKNVDEECKMLLKDSERSCPQFKNFHKVKSHKSLQKGGSHEVHDIEDLVDIGKSVKGCAYYAARSMANDALIVFCPYAYLLNPIIRNAMEINIEDAIVILDEAHNIEDVAREAGSIDLDTSMLEGMRTELEQLSSGSSADIYQPLLEMVQDVLSWIYEKSNLLQKQDFERYSFCWCGESALKELESAGISFLSFPMLADCAKKAIGAAADAEPDSLHLSGFSAAALEGLFSVLTYMLKDSGKHLLDYRVVIQKYVKRDDELGVNGWINSLSLWCLNPAVVFQEVASKARSIILTSGTLSPIGSFASELGVPFEVCMEAPHVIDMKSQVFAACIAKGPGNVPLNASYKHADGYSFQDALATTLEEIFKVSPDGALVFFPSYKLLDKLCDRWKSTGHWKRLSSIKRIFIEPRGKLETFECMLEDYYQAINGKSKNESQKIKSRPHVKQLKSSTCSDMKDQPKNGAAFLAVCRGKVSEGIDFSDKYARVVVVVGIPFPNQKDLQVNMKKQYNTENRLRKNLLTGDQWYCYQAFRALNQAVGRCIRHRHDYGAIILLDERYKRSSYLDYMSKWLRGSIQQIESLDCSLKRLKTFFLSSKVTSVDASNDGNTKCTINMEPEQNVARSCNDSEVSSDQQHRVPFDDISPRLNSSSKAEAVVCDATPEYKMPTSSFSEMNNFFEAEIHSISGLCQNTPAQQKPTFLYDDVALDGKSESYRKTSDQQWQPECSAILTCNFSSSNDLARNRLSQSATPIEKGDPIVRSLSSDFSVCTETSLKNSFADNTFTHRLEENQSLTNGPEEYRNICCRALCSKCGGSLSNGSYGSKEPRVTLKKKFLKELLKGSHPHLPDFSDVLIYDMSMLDTRVNFDRVDGWSNKRSQTVWVEEDGCVYRPLFCPWCTNENRIGAHIVAADRTNMHLVDKALLFTCALEICEESSRQVMQVAPHCEDVEADGPIWLQPCTEIFSKRGNQTPSRPKLKLRRRE